MIAIDLATSYADARASAARTPLNSPARTYALEAAAGTPKRLASRCRVGMSWRWREAEAQRKEK